MAQEFSLSQSLRLVGQMLEPLNVESFALRVDSEKVSVRAQRRVERQAPAQDLTLRDVWQVFRRKKTDTVQESQPSFETVELNYTYDDIKRLDNDGQSNKRATGGRPDAHALSQILRAVGAYVDQKQGKLLSVTKEGQDLTIEYESMSKQAMTETFTVSSLYDFWIKMYLRRRDRS
ncbi:MAG: hypothetical protein HW419_1617 [Deltaproteobacteria bacterium]|nr:hypothetical protein [Deltaproteobacteria bacterium]